MNRQVFSIINPTPPKKPITFARAFPITRKMLSEAESALSFLVETHPRAESALSFLIEIHPRAESALSFLIEKYHILGSLSTF